MDSKSADFCAAGKTIVGATCYPFIENTVDLRYDLKFEFEIVEAVFEKAVVVLSLLENVRKQVIEGIVYSLPVSFSSATVSGIGPCLGILTSKTLNQLETNNTTENNIISLEAYIIVGYTKIDRNLKTS